MRNDCERGLLWWGGMITSIFLVVLCPMADSEETEKPKKDERETSKDNDVAQPGVHTKWRQAWSPKSPGFRSPEETRSSGNQDSWIIGSIRYTRLRLVTLSLRGSHVPWWPQLSQATIFFWGQWFSSLAACSNLMWKWAWLALKVPQVNPLLSELRITIPDPGWACQGFFCGGNFFW